MITHLLGTTTEHALYTKTDWHDVHRRTPVFVQYGETDVTVAINVRMDGYVVSNEYYLKNKSLCDTHLYFIQQVRGVS